MQPLDTIETDYKGYTIRVKVYHDPDMGPPWEEHDGHGIVSDWETRDKRPGERVLCSDRNSHRFYDFAATMKKAKEEGWGCGVHPGGETCKCGKRHKTHGECLACAVEQDFEHLRGWCNDDWHWVGYESEILDADGTLIDTGEIDSCWGYDDAKYMVEEAQGNAEATIDRDIEARAKEQSESELMACRDIATT